MSQDNVERIIGRLATDEGFRRLYAADPRGVIEGIVAGGAELNACEVRALLRIDGSALGHLAETLDPCIQKIELTPRRES